MTNKEHEALVDRVVRTILDAERKSMGLPHRVFHTQADKEIAKPMAQAAIAAVREAISDPNANQEQAGMKCIMDGTGYVNHEIYVDPETPWHTWKSMLAASPLGNGGNGNE